MRKWTIITKVCEGWCNFHATCIFCHKLFNGTCFKQLEDFVNCKCFCNRKCLLQLKSNHKLNHSFSHLFNGTCLNQLEDFVNHKCSFQLKSNHKLNHSFSHLFWCFYKLGGGGLMLIHPLSASISSSIRPSIHPSSSLPRGHANANNNAIRARRACVAAAALERFGCFVSFPQWRAWRHHQAFLSSLSLSLFIFFSFSLLLPGTILTL